MSQLCATDGSQGNAQPLSPPLHVAVVTIAGVPLAVPVADVEHVLQRPVQLAQLPRSQAVLDGVIAHQGQPVPVMNLSRWGSLNESATNPLQGHGTAPLEAPQRVMLLRSGGRRVGVAIDSTRELLRIPPTGVHRVYRDDAAQEPFHTMVSPADGRPPLALLDAERLMHAAEIWVQAAGAADTPADALLAAANDETSRARQDDAAPLHALVQMGSVRCAFPAQQVGALIPLRLLPAEWRKSAHGPLLGMLRWRGRDVPVLSANTLLESDEADSAMTAALVLHNETRAMAVPVTAFQSVQPVPVRRLAADSVRALRHAPLYHGLWNPLGREGVAPQATSADGSDTVRVVNADALLGSADVSQLGAPAPSTTIDLATQDRPNRETYLLLSAGRTVAVAARLLQEVLPLPPSVEWTDHAHRTDTATSAACGHFTWRDQQVPLEDWGLQLTGTPTQRSASQRIALIQRNGHWCGLLMDAVVGMVPAMGGRRSWATLRGSQRVELLTATVQGQVRSYQITNPLEMALSR